MLMESSDPQQPSGSLFFSTMLCLIFKKLLECDGVVQIALELHAVLQAHAHAALEALDAAAAASPERRRWCG